jgi:hypothetical protein
MASYRARQPEIDAICFEGDNFEELAEFLGVDPPSDLEAADQVVIELPEGEEQVNVGDYIARTPDGFDCYPRQSFERCYVPAGEGV